MAIKIRDIIRGNTRGIDLLFLRADGTSYDLTGGKVFFVATSQEAPTDDLGAAIDKVVTVHTAPTLGQSRIVLTATDTSIPPGSYNCGAQAVLADGTVLEDTGKLKIKPEYSVSTT